MVEAAGVDLPQSSNSRMISRIRNAESARYANKYSGSACVRRTAGFARDGDGPLVMAALAFVGHGALAVLMTNGARLASPRALRAWGDDFRRGQGHCRNVATGVAEISWVKPVLR
jgi:hypothetical protein